MFTDTHCHILSNYYYNLEETLQNLENNHIKRIIINGYDLKSNQEVIQLSQKYSNVYGALGIHPDNLSEDNIQTINFIKNNLNNPKIIACGEIGLDYYHNKDNKQDQLNLLEDFLKIAEEYQKPVIIHNREATDDLLKLLKKYHVKGIIHCFSGSLETANEYLKLGFKLGIGGVLTFKNSKLRETLKEIPITNILLETDSPYLTPEPLRGLKNEPMYLKFIADSLSSIYNTSVDELTDQLEQNFLDTFDIKK
jgi:TatD DNase family protein